MNKHLALRHLLLIEGRKIAGQPVRPDEESSVKVLRTLIDSLDVTAEAEPARAFRINANDGHKTHSLQANDADFSFYVRGDAATEKELGDAVADRNAANARALWGVLSRLAGAPLAPEFLSLSRELPTNKMSFLRQHALEAGLVAATAAVLAVWRPADGLVLATFYAISRALGASSTSSAVVSCLGIASNHVVTHSRAHLLSLGSLVLLLAGDRLRGPWLLALAGASLSIVIVVDRTLGTAHLIAGLLMYDISALLAPWRTSRAKITALHISAAASLAYVMSVLPVANDVISKGDPLSVATRLLLLAVSGVFWFTGTHLNPIRILIPLYLLVLAQISGDASLEAPLALLMAGLWLRHFPLVHRLVPRSAIHASKPA